MRLDEAMTILKAALFSRKPFMPRDWRIHVEDILEALSMISKYIDGMT